MFPMHQGQALLPLLGVPPIDQGIQLSYVCREELKIFKRLVVITDYIASKWKGWCLNMIYLCLTLAEPLQREKENDIPDVK